MSLFYDFFFKKSLKILILLAFIVFINIPDIYAKTITINIWDFPRWLEPGEKTDRFKWIKHKIKQFELQHPNVKIKLTQLTWKRGKEKLKIAALGGYYPDISAGTIPLLFIKEKLIEPINPYLTEKDLKDYLPGALNAFKIKNKIYGWPWYMSGQLLYVNKAILQKAKIKIPSNNKWTTKKFTRILTKLKNISILPIKTINRYLNKVIIRSVYIFKKMKPPISLLFLHFKEIGSIMNLNSPAHLLRLLKPYIG